MRKINSNNRYQNGRGIIIIILYGEKKNIGRNKNKFLQETVEIYFSEKKKTWQRGVG